MSDWILVPCLVALRNEFNAIAPDRDKRTDGSKGDAAHEQTVSDHNPDETGTVPIHDADSRNEVHAIDVDSSGPWPEMNGKPGSMERVVQHLLSRCRANLEDRLRYIIYDHRIWSASSNWAQQTYTGSNPHTEHAHFSASYGSVQEADTHSWHLEDLVALTPDEIADVAEATVTKLLDTVLQTPYDTVSPNRKVRDLIRYIASRDVVAGAVDAKLAPRFLAITDAVSALDVVDEQDRAQIAATILAGLPANLAERVAQETLDGMAARLGASDPATPPA